MSGSAQKIELKFIVCSDSSAKTGVVRKFASDMESLGLTGAIRVSPLHCHSTQDIDDFLRVTAEIAATVKA